MRTETPTETESKRRNPVWWVVPVLLVLYVVSYYALSWKGKQYALQEGMTLENGDLVWSFVDNGRPMSMSGSNDPFPWPRSWEGRIERFCHALYYPLIRLDRFRGFTHVIELAAEMEQRWDPGRR